MGTGSSTDVAITWDFVWGGSFVANGFLGLISSIYMIYIYIYNIY